MEGFRYVDLFATKGPEYLLVIGYLMLLIPFWRFLSTPARGGLETVSRLVRSLSHWFQIPDTLYYHQGHSWVMPEARDLVKVGIDDFAQKLLGKPKALELPNIGAKLRQGEVGWKVGVDSKSIEMLSPVSGEVVAVNKEILQNPELINQDPYGKGWLMMIKPNNMTANFKNLLTGRLATAWMEATADALWRRMGSDLGVVYQDGGVVVSGIAKALSPDGWDKLAKEFLLTAEEEMV